MLPPERTSSDADAAASTRASSLGRLGVVQSTSGARDQLWPVCRVSTPREEPNGQNAKLA